VGNRVDIPTTIMECQAVTGVPSTDSCDDLSLVNAARNGDRAAFGRLYERYARMVHGILLTRVPLSEVDDLVQDVFLLALPRLEDLRDIARFGPWLAAITRNRAHDYHRQSRTAIELTGHVSAEEAEGRATSGLEEAEAAVVLAIIRGLSETYRETLILRLVEGMTGPEIAARTGLSPGSVRVNLHRGMEQLRKKLSQVSTASRKRNEHER
jgi:RNA polymerase sigma-70 factor (ECF subfamily)